MELSKKKIIEALCPNCNGSRKCKKYGQVIKHWDFDDGAAFGSNLYMLLECRGCETTFLHITSENSEDWDYGRVDGHDVMIMNKRIQVFPSIIEEAAYPDWVWKLAKVDHQLTEIVKQIIEAENKELITLASIGLRTALERTAEVLFIHPGLTLNEKVETLQSEGFIGDTEARLLLTVANVGNAAAHRGWSPNRDEFNSLFSCIENFIKRTVLTARNFEEISKRIPPREPRPKKVKRADDILPDITKK
ncbi:DUF4145 domain-containing protein [Pantoea ananatis]|uniref:DUF4145 domain-containing protein n=1 Tax=Pantoea ananas TaxID=553 RepID=UPI003CEDF692